MQTDKLNANFLHTYAYIHKYIYLNKNILN